MAARSSTCSCVSIPRLQATWMSTASRIAATPTRTCSMSFASGPRTAATMQNSVAPVAAVSTAALTSDGTSSHAARTGEANRPDWLQKWQSSGQPPVLRLTMPSTSTSGPQWRIRTSWASCEQLGQPVVAEPQARQRLLLASGRRRARAPARAATASTSAGSARDGRAVHAARSRGGVCQAPRRDGRPAHPACASRKARASKRPPSGRPEPPRRPPAGSRSRSSAPAPSSQRPEQRAGRERLEVAHVAAARRGRARRARPPTTTPARSSPRCASASSVRAVALRLPSPAVVTTRTGARTARATSASVSPSSSKRTSSPPAPSTSDEVVRGVQAQQQVHARRRGPAASGPLRRAAAAGDSGSG